MGLNSVYLSPAPNFGTPVLYILWGELVFFLLPLIIIGETFILRAMKWDTTWRSFIASLLMNFVSAVIGSIFFFDVIDSTPGVLEILFSWAASFVIEFCCLWLFRKHTTKFVLNTAFMANAVSYMGILILYFIFIHPVPAFPDTDIVYLNNLSRTELGFVNQDGSAKQFIEMGPRLSKSVWSADGKTLYLLETGQGVDGGGDISIWKEGKRKHTCIDPDWVGFTNFAGFIPSSRSRAIVTSHYFQIWLIDIQKCQKIEVLVDKIDSYYNDIRIDIYGGSLSPDGKYLLYTKEVLHYGGKYEYSILKLDLVTRETISIGEGINPRWSPDGSKVAYLQLDGIYVMLADGTQPRRIITHDFLDDPNLGSFSIITPEPNWSPDGEWLIYHLWIHRSPGNNGADIFKLNIASGEEIKVADDGLYPYWRK